MPSIGLQRIGGAKHSKRPTRVLTGDEIRALIQDPESGLEITPEPQIEGVSVRLSVGRCIHRPGNPGAITLGEGEGIQIDPGEFILIETRERVRLGPCYAGALGPRFRQASFGLELVNGFLVEPGFDQPLLLGLRNNGPRRITLQQHQGIVTLAIMHLREAVPADSLWKNHDNRGDIIQSILQQHQDPGPSTHQLSQRLDEYDAAFQSAQEIIRGSRKIVDTAERIKKIAANLLLALLGAAATALVAWWLVR